MTGGRLQRIDLARYAGGGPAPHVHSFSAAEPGPHVAITAIVHGNELCGAHVLAELLDRGVRPRRGRLTLAFANPAAHDAPGGPVRCLDADMNRLWTDDQPAGNGREAGRARVLAPLLRDADILLDLHAMASDGPPLILAGMTARALTLARRLRLGFPIVRDRGHAGGTRLFNWGRFASDDAANTALLVECGRADDPASVDTARAAASVLLCETGLIGREAAEALGALPEHADPPLVLTVSDVIVPRTAQFRFHAAFSGLAHVARRGTPIARDGEKTIRTPYDDCWLVMPSTVPEPGQTAVRLAREGL